MESRKGTVLFLPCRLIFLIPDGDIG